VRHCLQFSGPEDPSKRSAWEPTPESFQPPKMVNRQDSVGEEDLEDAMRTSAASETTTASRVRFSGPEDSSMRSAWKSTSKSLQPPKMVARRKTLDRDGVAQITEKATASKRSAWKSTTKFCEPAQMVERQDILGDERLEEAITDISVESRRNSFSNVRITQRVERWV